MEFISEYGLFLAKIATAVIAVLTIIIVIFALNQKEKKGKLKITKLNDTLDDMTKLLKHAVLTKSELKAEQKKEKKVKKAEKKQASKGKNVYVLDFKGDIKATAVKHLRHEVTALLTIATPKDEVVLRLESPGGIPSGYGLAASQLKRIRDKDIMLTVTIDQVAASGGYMMAAVANRILAAPFAIIGSIGVIAQLPNFHRLLKKHNVDYEQIMAGEYKRTLSYFGEITDKGRKKFQEVVEELHELFKAHITQNRPEIDINSVATGEYWQGATAKNLNLVDDLVTSDEYLFNLSGTHDIYAIKYQTKKTLTEKLESGVSILVKRFFTSLKDQDQQNIF